MQTEFQCSYSLQLLLGNQQHIPAAHFHVYSFAFPSGNVLVLLQRGHTRSALGAQVRGRCHAGGEVPVCVPIHVTHVLRVMRRFAARRCRGVAELCSALPRPAGEGTAP